MPNRYFNEKNTIITANKRQVLALRSWYVKQSQVNGLQSILPIIIDYQSFIAKEYTHHIKNSKVILTDYEQFLIWQSIVYSRQQQFNQYDQTLELSHHYQALVKVLQGEYALIRQFAIPLNALDHYFQDKTKLFVAAARHYQQILAKAAWVDLFDAVEVLSASNHWAGRCYHYYGFKQLTPQQSKFFTAIDACVLNDLEPLGVIAKQVAYDNIDAELSAAIQWLYQQSQQNSNQRLAFIVPNLPQLKNKIIAQLDEVFSLDQHLVDDTDKPYNLSLGQFLSHYPIIKTAIDIIKFAGDYKQNIITHERLKAVLLSGFIAGSKEEMSQRHQLANLLTNQVFDTIQLKTHTQVYSPIFYQQLVALEQQLNTLNITQKNTYNSWATIFHQILDIFSWGCTHLASSSQYQLFNKYHQSMLLFHRLDRLESVVSFTQALSHWVGLLSQAPFQPKLTKITNIHIIGQLEAQGSFFDQAWIMGLNTTFLPGMIKSYTFIPQALAIQYSLLKSNYELLEKEAQISKNQLLRLASVYHLSYAKTVDDTTQFHTPYFIFDNNTTAIKSVNAPQLLTKITDHIAPKLTDNNITQGISIIKNQLSCAFKGFAGRLNIDEYDENLAGISAMEKGQNIHQVLENIYQTIKCQTDLKKQQHNLSDFVWQHITSIYPIDEDIFWQIEAKRVQKIIVDFLNLELNRPDFKVLAVEKYQQIKLAGLSFNIRLDRLDEDELGNHIVIDYKTGKPALNHIGLLRTGFGLIKEPQLPIYALFNDIAALAFVQLRSEEVRWIGCGKTDILVDFFKKNSHSEKFSELNTYWQQQLTAVAQDFKQGKAEVLPQKNACDYCQLDSLCRIKL